MMPPKNILIVRTDRIGDVVLSLPMAGILKNHFPDCKVTFLIREYTKPLLEDYPDIDDVIVAIELNGKMLFRENIKSIKEKNFDLCIAANPKFNTALLLFFCGIKTRIGTGYRWYSFLFNKKVYEHRRDAKRHELEYNVNLLKPLGIVYTASHKNIHFNLTPDREMRDRVKKELKESGINLDKELVIVHPGSGGSAVDIPFDSLRIVIEKLLAKKIQVCLTGSESEKDLCNSLLVDLNGVNFSGKYNLKELIALISLADVFMANSTGPLHIAAALGVQTVGFYPKIKECSPERWGPYSAKAKVFQPEIDCKNCNRVQCGKLDCMRSIDPEKIVSYIEKILSPFQIGEKNG